MSNFAGLFEVAPGFADDGMTGAIVSSIIQVMMLDNVWWNILEWMFQWILTVSSEAPGVAVAPSQSRRLLPAVKRARKCWPPLFLFWGNQWQHIWSRWLTCQGECPKMDPLEDIFSLHAVGGENFKELSKFVFARADPAGLDFGVGMDNHVATLSRLPESVVPHTTAGSMSHCLRGRNRQRSAVENGGSASNLLVFVTLGNTLLDFVVGEVFFGIVMADDVAVEVTLGPVDASMCAVGDNVVGLHLHWCRLVVPWISFFGFFFAASATLGGRSSSVKRSLRWRWLC